jgi:hypothetical protein
LKVQHPADGNGRPRPIPKGPPPAEKPIPGMVAAN